MSVSNFLNGPGLLPIRDGAAAFGVATLLGQSVAAPFVAVTYALKAGLKQLAEKVEVVRNNVVLRVLWEGPASIGIAYTIVKLLVPGFQMPALFWLVEVALLFIDSDQEADERGISKGVTRDVTDFIDRLAPEEKDVFVG